MYSQGVAQYYDLFAEEVGQRPAEAAFLRALLPRSSSILDIGAGSGNSAFALATDGHAVTALEPDGEMYAAMLVRLALRKDLQGNLTPVPKPLGFDLQQRFDACVCFSVLHLLDEALRATLFRYACAQLRRGGRHILETPAESPRRAERARELRAERTFGATRYQHFVSMNRTPGGRWCTSWEFLAWRGELLLDRRTRDFDWKPNSLAEVSALAQGAGLAVEATFGAFDRSPYADGESQVLVAVFRNPD